jgi:CRP-like cAMP-binding protein
MLEDPIARQRRLQPPPAEEPATRRANIRAALANQSIFGRTSPAAQQDLVGRLRMRCVGAGGRLFSPRRPTDALFILHRGRARLYVHDGADRSMTLAVLRPGDVCGENATLGSDELGITAEALERITVLVLPHEQLLAHLRAHPETAMPLLMEASRLIHQRTELVASLALHEVNARLARTLLNLARQQPAAPGESLLIANRPTHRELAAMIGTRRETVSRALKRFAREGLVTVTGRQIRLSPRLSAQAG